MKVAVGLRRVAAGKRTSGRRAAQIALRPDLREEWHFEKNKKIKMNEVTLHSNKKVWWRCKNGHEWRTTVAIRSRGSNCPYCSK